MKKEEGRDNHINRLNHGHSTCSVRSWLHEYVRGSFIGKELNVSTGTSYLLIFLGSELPGNYGVEVVIPRAIFEPHRNMSNIVNT
jgi:hypothetical protein